MTHTSRAAGEASGEAAGEAEVSGANTGDAIGDASGEASGVAAGEPHTSAPSMPGSSRAGFSCAAASASQPRASTNTAVTIMNKPRIVLPFLITGECWSVPSVPVDPSHCRASTFTLKHHRDVPWDRERRGSRGIRRQNATPIMLARVAPLPAVNQAGCSITLPSSSAGPPRGEMLRRWSRCDPFPLLSPASTSLIGKLGPLTSGKALVSRGHAPHAGRCPCPLATTLASPFLSSLTVVPEHFSG